jgi:predicted cupin superfamily sugar epimerase
VQRIIELLGLSSHPEGGFYRETSRHSVPWGDRTLGKGHPDRAAVAAALESNLEPRVMTGVSQPPEGDP